MESLQVTYKRTTKPIPGWPYFDRILTYPEHLKPSPWLIDWFFFIWKNRATYPKFFGSEEPIELKWEETQNQIIYSYCDLPGKGTSTIVFSIPRKNEAFIDKVTVIYYFGELLSGDELEDILKSKFQLN